GEDRGASRYRIIRPITRGPTSEVLEAVAIGEGRFERRVAIKRLTVTEDDGKELVTTFLDEAKLSSQLHHANVVGVIDFGVKERVPFLVLEYVDGADLQSLDRYSKKSGDKM